jgi:hypothetical protein
MNEKQRMFQTFYAGAGGGIHGEESWSDEESEEEKEMGMDADKDYGRGQSREKIDEVTNSMIK